MIGRVPSPSPYSPWGEKPRIFREKLLKARSGFHAMQELPVGQKR